MTNMINSNVNSKQCENVIVTTTGNASASCIGSNNEGELGTTEVEEIVSNTANNATAAVVALINDSPVLPGASESPATPFLVATMKKVRSKAASPTRHGPQQCQVCNKVFGNASALAKHKLTHSDERKYVCGMCSKAFKRQDHLNGHMLTHRNKKPFECKADGCGKSYCDARSLRRHTENHHNALALTATTPINGTILASPSSTGPPTGLSLSPATANGDASSPHGATFVPFNGDGQSSLSSSSFSSASSSSSSSSPAAPSSPAMMANFNGNSPGNDGLTKQQLDLISQIMQHTKQANAVMASQKQRPRTWNMQTKLQQTPTNNTTTASNIAGGPTHNGQRESANNHSPQAQTESVPARTLVSGSASHQLGNGTPPTTNINLQKSEPKPVECNLCHRKFKNIPALNGHMRLHGGYFKKDSDSKKSEKKEIAGPPLQTASIGVRALIEEKIISKRSKHLKGAFLVPASPLSTRRSPETETFVMTPKLTAATVSAVHSNGSGTAPQLVRQQQQPITGQTIHIPISTGVTSHHSSSSSNGATTTKSIILGDNKDATLIELLKRGTKVAVKRSLSDPQQILLTTTTTTTATTSNNGQMLPTSGQRTLNAILQNAKAITAGETGRLLQATLAGQLSNKGFSFNSDHTSPLTLSIGGTPAAAGICGGTHSSSDIFNGSNGSAFFNDGDVYSINDTAMLLQAVEPIQLIHEADELSPLDDFEVPHSNVQLSTESIAYTPSTQLQAVLNSPLPDSLAEFSTLHSKEYVLYDSPTPHSAGESPLPSPLAYPTPPASHEAVAQSSPFLDDSHHFTDANNPFFGGDDKSRSFLDAEPNKTTLVDELSSGAQIRDLKNDDIFSDSKSMRQIFKEAEDNGGVGENRLQDLSFLDEPQSFLDDDNRHVSSALSAAFFSSTMTSAEEVKEALQVVLPNEAGSTGSTATDAEIDLYYLPMLPIQSHMMSNSDDPLLSSSPKDFGGRPQSDRHAAKHELTATLSPPSSKRHKTEPTNDSRPFRHASEPTNARSCDTLRQGAAISIPRKRVHRREIIPKPYELYKSRLKGGCLEDSPNCYTPAPILNPIRRGTGIYFCLLKERPSALDEVESVPHTRLPQINVGQRYQAEIPDYSPFEVLDEDELLETCMWSPEVITADEQCHQLQRYVDLAKSAAMPMGSNSEETALKALLDGHGEFQSAILELLQTPSVHLNRQWTPAEMTLFITGLDKWQKDFNSIAKTIPRKTTSDCVQLYYFWKKLSVHYKAPHLLKDWTEMAGKRAKFENYEKTAARTMSESGSRGNFTAAAPNYSATSAALGGGGSSSSHSLSSAGTEISKLMSTAGAATSFSTSAMTMSAAPPSSSSSSHHDVRPYICEMPDCSASFSSKAALHGHKKLHCMGRNFSLTSANSSNHTNSANHHPQQHPNHSHHTPGGHHHPAPPNYVSPSAHNHPHSSALPSHGSSSATATTSTGSHTPQHSNIATQTTAIIPGLVIGPAPGVSKDDFPCKVCGKVFGKVKSRSAHMKSHRPQESDLITN